MKHESLARLYIGFVRVLSHATDGRSFLIGEIGKAVNQLTFARLHSFFEPLSNLPRTLNFSTTVHPYGISSKRSLAVIRTHSQEGNVNM